MQRKNLYRNVLRNRSIAVWKLAPQLISVRFPWKKISRNKAHRVLLLQTFFPSSLLKRRAAVAELSPEFPVLAPPRQKARVAQRERNNLTALFEFTFLLRIPRARISAVTFVKRGASSRAITSEANVPSQRSLCKFKCDRASRRAITRAKLFHGS